VKVFDSFETLETCLYMQSPNLHHEFWLDVCAPLPEGKDALFAISALRVLRHWLDASNEELHPRALLFIEGVPLATALQECWLDDLSKHDKGAIRARIINRGERLHAVREAHAWMSETMLIDRHKN
jgi:hypothetical protein